MRLVSGTEYEAQRCVSLHDSTVCLVCSTEGGCRGSQSMPEM